MGWTLQDWKFAIVGILGIASLLGLIALAFLEVIRAVTVGSGEESQIPRAGQAAAASLVPLAVDHAARGVGWDDGYSGGFDSGDGGDGWD